MYQTLHKPYIKLYMANYKKSLNHTQTGHSNPTFCDRRRTGERNLEHESREWSDWCDWNDWCEWSDWSKSYVTFVTNVTNATNVTYVKQEMAIGGDTPRYPLRATQKSNNFERFFSDSTLTFLTYRNTFHLPILPTRRAVFLCLPQI